MSDDDSALQDRVHLLERSLRRLELGVIGGGLVVVALMGVRLFRGPAEIPGEVRTRRLIVVDDENRMRVEIGEDPKDTERRARSAGLRVFDNTGYERGGFSTFEDGSVVFAMDAPNGVGAPMPDRIGLMVYPDGATHINLLDNETRAVARLYTDADGKGGVQVLKWDMPGKQILFRTLTYDGDLRETRPMGE